MSLPSRAETLVAIATYNEIENLPHLAEQIFRHAPQVDLLVIDDASPDGTGKWVDAQARQDPRMHALHRAGKLGLGTAIVAGMKYAIAHGYQRVVTMDADFSHHPKYLPELLAATMPAATMPADKTPADVAIGSRYIRGGAIEGWPLKRHAMSRGINFYARLFLGLKLRDCSGGYRCYRVDRLNRIDLDRLLSHGYAFQEEVLWRLVRDGCRVVETPIVFVDRVRGNSKINLGEACEAFRVVLRLGLRNLLRAAPAAENEKASPERGSA